MNTRPACRAAMAFSLLAVSVFSGCRAMTEAGFYDPNWLADPAELRREEEDYRRRFRAEGDPAAVRWLMANRLGNGMPLDDVNQIFGQDGEREFGDTWLKAKGGHYRATDEAYRWGPDRDGNVYYLVFRDGVLTNFDPRQYHDEPF